jgi:hypothetical protein
MTDHIIGGSPFGQGDARVNVGRAVLLDTVNVVLVGTATWDQGAGRAIGLELGGRVNKSVARVQTLFLMDEDGAAAVVTELIGMAGRAGADQFIADVLRRLDDLPGAK